MSRRISCPGCDATLTVPDESAGRSLVCPKCRVKFRLPATDGDAETASRQSADRGASPAKKPRSARPERPANSGDFWENGGDLGLEMPALPRRRESAGQTKKEVSRKAKTGPAVPLWAIFAVVGFVGCLALALVNWLVFLRPQPGPPSDGAIAAINSPANSGDGKSGTRAAGNAASKSRGGRPSPRTKGEENVAATGNEQLALASRERAPLGPRRSLGSSSGQILGGPPGADIPLEDLIEQASESVVLIKVFDKSGKELGFGSGFVIDSSGLVATCLHVVRRAHRAVVQFRDGKTVEVSGARQLSPQTDLAILELAGKPANLIPLRMPENFELKPGQEVIAFGHPRGLKFTPTKGMVNNVHKTADLPAGMRLFLSIMNVSKDDEWIQTDAVISEGNSGGPLINRKGEVIGINSWISKDTHFAFAVHVRHLAELKTRLYAKAEPLSDAIKKILAAGGSIEVLDEKVEQVLNDYQREAEEYSIELERMKSGNPTRAEADAFVRKNPANRYAPKLLQLGSANRKSKTAFQAYAMACFLLKGTDPKTTNRFLQQATEALLEDHISEKELGGVALLMAAIPQHETKGFLRSLVKRSPHREVQAFACLALATNLQRQATEKPDSNAAAAADKEIVTLLSRITQEFPDVLLGGKPMSELTKPLLYEKEHLSIGVTAPDIVGTDAEGKDFRLKDYRGKVVLLEFWGDWCPHCQQLYPYERILVTKFQGRRFAMLGVNSDPPDQFEAVQKSKKVNWRSWGDGHSGPIATQWNVNSFPTMYIIDHKGIIRFRGTLDPDFVERAVESLLAEAEPGRKGAARKRPGRRTYSRP